MPISTIAELDLDSMKLGPVCEMPLPRAYPSMVFFPDSLILIGGTNCWEDVFNNVSQYDFLEQRWYKWPKLINNRYGHNSITLDEKYIFVVGGCNRNENILNTEWYDRSKKKWEIIGKLKSPMNKCHCLRYNNSDIFVTSHLNKIVQKFDLNKQKYTLTKPLNYIYPNGNKLCTFDYKLLCLSKTNIYSYEIYDKNTNEWIFTNSKLHPIHPFNKLYTKKFKKQKILDWYHLGRRYW